MMKAEMLATFNRCRALRLLAMLEVGGAKSTLLALPAAAAAASQPSGQNFTRQEQARLAGLPDRLVKALASTLARLPAAAWTPPPLPARVPAPPAAAPLRSAVGNPPRARGGFHCGEASRVGSRFRAAGPLV